MKRTAGDDSAQLQQSSKSVGCAVTVVTLRTFFEQKNYARFRQHFSAVIER
jgi:hypothetical protein